MSGDVTGGYAELMAAHDFVLIPRAGLGARREGGLRRSPSPSRSSGDPPPAAAGRARSWSRGRLAGKAPRWRCYAPCTPEVEVAVIARFEAQAALARQLGAPKGAGSRAPPGRHRGAGRLVRRGCCTRPWPGLPMASRWHSMSSTTRSGSPRPSRWGSASFKARGTLVKSRRARTRDAGNGSPFYFKEISLGGLEHLGDRRGRREVRRHGIAHYLDLVEAQGRVDLTGMLTHTFTLDK